MHNGANAVDGLAGPKRHLDDLFHNQGVGFAGWLGNFLADTCGIVDGSDQYEVNVNALPTIIPSQSAMMGTSTSQWGTYWKDYWFDVVDNYHNVPLPPGASRMILSWASEYLKGRESADLTGTEAPVCSPGAGSVHYVPAVHPYKTNTTTTNSASNLACRAFTPESQNGVDDDGDELIDEAACQNATCETARASEAA